MLGEGGVDGGVKCVLWVMCEWWMKHDVFNNSIRGWKETIAREVVQNVV